MSKIRILDSLVIDRIAAGEVVERPASVAKELVENSLDAGATRIDVRLEESGMTLLEVADNGHGMAAEDAELAFAQHATSKVRSVADLDAIATMGFRGEALASIASVARVELVCSTGEGPGVRVRVESGKLQSIDEVAWPRGTTIRVADLFWNTPARRKNLKKPATELRHVSQTIIDYALGRPDVHVSLTHGKRALLTAPPVATIGERVHQVLGADVSASWLPVEYASGAVRVSGGITSPEHQRPNRNDIRWFVNGRPVTDYRLVHAMVGAYDSLLDARRYPVAVIFLELPVADVDVNVHPRKAEVRFANPGAVYRIVRRAVRESLAHHMPPVSIRPQTMSGPPAGAAILSGGPQSLPVEGWIVAEGMPVAAHARSGAWSVVGTVATPGTEGVGPQIQGTSGSIRPLAQYANTYILAADDRGLLIIDQHVAHERVLYEQVLAQMEERGVEAQHLLVPEPVELSAAEVAALEVHEDLLESVGFVVEPFGGSSWAVQTAPAVLGARNLPDALRSMLESMSQGQGAEAVDEARQAVAASIACHAAVRANHPLTLEEMVRLIADLERCESPTRCPHGRPILVRLDHAELERRIGRH